MPRENAAASGAISAHELISFDVFDTALFRAIARPTDVFLLVKLKLMTAPEALHHPEVIDGFPELRIAAEAQARQRKRAADACTEVTFDEIYAEFARLSGADADLVELLAQTELDLEAMLVYPNELVNQLLLYARAQGKRVIFCSDMYLPGAIVERLLSKCGFTDHDGIFVSCEHAYSKHDGSMFRYIASRFEVPPGRILHLGDNEHADYTMARDAGCTAIHLPHQRLSDRVLMDIGHEKAFSGSAVGALIRGLVNKSLVEGRPAAGGEWERIGYRVFGPLFTGFMLWLANLIQGSRPQRVLLLARDAWFISRHLGRLLSRNGIDVPCHYLYVSRGALLIPSFTDFPLQRLWHLYSGKSRRTVAEHLRGLGLEPGMYAGAVRAVGYESLDDEVPNGDPKMHALLANLFAVLLREAALRRPLARRYIEQSIGDATRLAIVDIGWTGNMQGSILRLLGAAHRQFEVNGYYLGLHREAHDNDYPGHTMRGWLTHYGGPADFNGALLGGGVEILEFAMTAPHGTTLGYRQADDGRVEPILESNPQDAEYCRLAARVQAGAAEFLDDFLNIYGDLPPAVLIGRVWASELYRLVTTPTREEAELLGNLTHSDVAGATRERLPLAPSLPTSDRQAYAKAMERAYWKAGFKARNSPAAATASS